MVKIRLKDIRKNVNKTVAECHIISMHKHGYKGNTYQTFVIKIRAFLTFCFERNYLKKFSVKIPTVDLDKKVVYTENEIDKLIN
jgi:integrase/recombinase XerD